MKKGILLFLNVLLMLMILTSCSKPAVTPTDKPPKDTEQTKPKPVENILSLEEAQDLLINWCDLNEITYSPALDKEEDEIPLYGFLVDYFDNAFKYSGETYCYAWVNASTGKINFEEAGYLEANYSELGIPNLYTNIPDNIFPVPLRDGIVIPYDWFSPPEYVSGVTYSYKDKSVMESYQAQLRDAGFSDLGTIQSVESLWQYTQEDDGTTFTVEMYRDGETFSMNMYINYMLVD